MHLDMDTREMTKTNTCGHCGGMVKREVERGGTAREVCVICGKSIYLFKQDGGDYETQQERRNRLASVCVCERCEAEFPIPASTFASGQRPNFCPDCAAEGKRASGRKYRAGDPQPNKARPLKGRMRIAFGKAIA